MVDREKLMTTLQYRINEARNKGSKVTTIFISTLSDCMTLLKEQQQQIWELQDQVEYLTDKLKEQEADIIAMSRFLESHGWDSDSICGKNVEIVVTNGDDDDA